MRFPTLIRRRLSTALGVSDEIGLVLAPIATLTSPEIDKAGTRFQNLRARLADQPEARAWRMLHLLLLRAHSGRRNGNEALLRSLPELAPTRALAVRMTTRASRHDEEFRRLAADGDKWRDARNWRRGISAYTAALRIYSRHFGYVVQLSHCHKEIGDFTEAEVGYRDAVALGAPLADVWPHLDYVVGRSGGSRRAYPADVFATLEEGGGAASTRARLVTSQEVRMLAWLLLGLEEPSTAWLLKMMRAAPVREQTAERIVADPAFVQANRSLTALVGRGA